MQVNTLLAAKDGRKIGNALIVGIGDWDDKAEYREE